MNCRHRARKISGTTIRNETEGSCRRGYSPKYRDPEWKPLIREMVGTGRFELPTPRTPSECSTRLSHVPTGRNSQRQSLRMGVDPEILTSVRRFHLVRHPHSNTLNL